MHIKHIHNMIEKLSECAKVELDKGVENVDTKEMGEVAEIIKELCEAEYYAKISKAMDEAEYGEDYDYMGAYDEHSRKGYRGQPRDSRGRYMSRRRGYEEPVYRMTPEMYREMPIEWDRDMDRDLGRMYYSGSGSSGSSSSGSRGGSRSGMSDGMRGGNASMSGGTRYENARRGYEEKKQMGAEKADKMKSLEEYMKELSSDVSSILTDMSPEEKALAKQKLSVLVSKM